MVESVRERLPELPIARGRGSLRSISCGRRWRAADQERDIADTFEAVVGAANDVSRARTTANWMVNDVMGLHARGLAPDVLPFTAVQLSDLVDIVTAGELTPRAAKELLPAIEPGELPRAAATRLNLLSLDDDGAVRTAVLNALAANPAAVADFRLERRPRSAG